MVFWIFFLALLLCTVVMKLPTHYSSFEDEQNLSSLWNQNLLGQTTAVEDQKRISVAWPRKGSYPRTCRPRCFCLTCFAAADANTFCFRYRGAATFHSFSCKACKRKPRDDDKYLVQSKTCNAGLDGFGSREDALSLGSTPTGWVKKCLLCF